MKAIVNYNAMNTWLEPYIGHKVSIIIRGIKRSIIDVGYGWTRADTQLLDF